MRDALTSELRKLLSTRLWWILLIGMAGYMAFLGVVLAFSLAQGSSMTGGSGVITDRDVVLSTYTLATALGYVFPLVMGALIITSEVRHQTLTPTFLFEPRRGVVLVAKLVVAGVLGIAFGLAGVAGALAGGAPVLVFQDIPLLLGDTEVLTALALTTLALGLWALIGVGLGSLLPNQVASIVVILAFTQFVEPILRIGLAAFEVTQGVARFLPGAAAESVVGSSLYTVGGGLELLERWQGALVLLVYVAVLTLLGKKLTIDRDIT